MNLQGTVVISDDLYNESLELAVSDYFQDTNTIFRDLVLDRVYENIPEEIELNKEEIDKLVKDAKNHAISLITNL